MKRIRGTFCRVELHDCPRVLVPLKYQNNFNWWFGWMKKITIFHELVSLKFDKLYIPRRGYMSNFP